MAQQSGEAARKRNLRKTLPDICKKWWAMRDSNSRHPRCKRGALPTELIALSRCRTSVRRVGGRDLCVTGENRKSVRAIFSNFLSRTGAPVRKSVDNWGAKGGGWRGRRRIVGRSAAPAYKGRSSPRGGEGGLTFGARLSQTAKSLPEAMLWTKKRSVTDLFSIALDTPKRTA